MALYKYTARDSEGKKISGTEDSLSPTDLLEILTKKGYVVTKLEPAGKRSQSQWWDIQFGKVPEDQFIFFNMQLSNMLEAGLPLLASLHILIVQIKNKRFRRVIEKVAHSVEEGKSLSESTAKFPKYFSDLFTSMIVVGEMSGNLDKVLTNIAKLLDDQLELKRKVKGAMTYPIVMTVLSGGVLALMVTMVVPYFVVIFGKVGVPLPLPTRILFMISRVVKSYWPFIIGICILIVIVLAFIKKTKWGSWTLDAFKLRIPIFGSLIKRTIMSRWARTLGTLMGGGVVILQSLAIAKNVVSNQVIEKSLDRAAEGVERGTRMADMFRDSKEFPIEVVQMINVGEESGTLDKMLVRIADYYDKLISYQVKQMSELIEPIFLIIIGGTVGFIMISVLLPIFDMIKVVQAGGM